MQNRVIEWMIYGLLFAGLLIEAIVDIRKRKIWVPIALIEIPLLIGLHYWMHQGSLFLWIASIGVGAFFYLISFVTKEQLGRGDALLFAMTGAGIGLQSNVLLLYLTFVMTFGVAAFLWLVKKVNKNYRMPLAPFVLCAYCVVVAERFL